MKGHRLLVDANLTRPVPYAARLDLQSWLQRIAYLTGGYESRTVEFLHRLWRTQGSGYLLDIGANVGLISIPFVLKARASSTEFPLVVAVEAVPDNAHALRANIAMNALGNSVQVIEMALGDQQKAVRIQVEGDLARGGGLGTANILADESTWACVTQSLELHTLDELLGSGALGPNCSVMKIDVDGYDLKVLQGGTEFLRKFRPVIFGEFAAPCLRWHDQSIRDVIRFADSLEYAVLFKEASDVLKFGETEPSGGFVQDLLLVPLEKRVEFSWCCEG